MIHLEKTTGKLPHGVLQWTEGNPMGNLLRFLILGEGDVAPVTHEVLRRAVRIRSGGPSFTSRLMHC